MKKIAINNSILCFALLLAMRVTQAADMAATNTPTGIPWNEIGAKAGADYKGEGLAVTPTESGARLSCVFQRLEGEATAEGLWLTSTVTNTMSDRFRVTAIEVGRVAEIVSKPARSGDRAYKTPQFGPFPVGRVPSRGALGLPPTGTVSVEGQTVRFSRPGLTEEYSVSMDGVRQDFILTEAPPCLVGPSCRSAFARTRGSASLPCVGAARNVVSGKGGVMPPQSKEGACDGTRAGELVVKLAVTGAQVEPAAYGARLVLENSGRKIAYSRLRVTDATGKELPARIEVCPVGDEATSLNSWELFGNNFDDVSLLTSSPTREELAVVVNDAEAVYPVRIDPTFSDANWSALGSGIGGEYAAVYALAVSGSTLYAGGAYFTTAGGTAANAIAQWNGSSWSALGSGIGGSYPYPFVEALAVSGGTLYAGGAFTTAHGSAANNIAQWNGSSWSALGSGISGTGYYGAGPYISALAVSGGMLYAGGTFSSAGGSVANSIAQWNGSSWSALGSGVNGYVWALAVSGGTLYAGGLFSTAGGSAANQIAQWNGSSWSALGSGLNNDVYALAVLGTTLYAGGQFTAADGSPVNYIAQWNGSSWSALASGMNSEVFALAVSGSTLYAGGSFTTAGGSAANYIAQWNGSSWSALGSGMNSYVYALAVSGGTLYAGGYFTTAGGNVADYVAEALLPGIDVSSDNGTISWDEVAQAGIQFAYVRATLGLPPTVDTQLTPNATGARANNIQVGVYHVSYAYEDTNHTGTAEADAFVNAAGAWMKTGFLPPAVNIEDAISNNYFISKIQDPVPGGTRTPAQLIQQYVTDFAAEVKCRTGADIIIYTGGDWLQYFVGNWAQKYGLWFSNPNGDPYEDPDIYPWQSMALFQYKQTTVTQNGSLTDIDVIRGVLPTPGPPQPTALAVGTQQNTALSLPTATLLPGLGIGPCATITGVSGNSVQGGTVTLDATQVVTYNPRSGFVGQDQFTVSLSAGSYNLSGTVSVTVGASGASATVPAGQTASAFAAPSSSQAGALGTLDNSTWQPTCDSFNNRVLPRP